MPNTFPSRPAQHSLSCTRLSPRSCSSFKYKLPYPFPREVLPPPSLRVPPYYLFSATLLFCSISYSWNPTIRILHTCLIRRYSPTTWHNTSARRTVCWMDAQMLWLNIHKRVEQGLTLNSFRHFCWSHKTIDAICPHNTKQDGSLQRRACMGAVRKPCFVLLNFGLLSLAGRRGWSWEVSWYGKSSIESRELLLLLQASWRPLRC